ncbi:hypothetical protein V6582_12920 [Agrobacterium vitis]|uniref:hypothetical protein n=1 Tax=Agrobacterium vitis TaxID=373 RepID=UPI0012E84EFB|nr:hypothetical protein [Agrobacterium vitis]MVA26876.1 hypothetical protein [Agrobacterium vitis]
MQDRVSAARFGNAPHFLAPEDSIAQKTWIDTMLSFLFPHRVFRKPDVTSPDEL